MAWHPNDLLTDQDLIAYERKILTQFGAYGWQERRQKALQDWLFPLLEGRGFAPQRLRTRSIPAAVVSETSSVITDRTAAAREDDGLSLAPILVAGTDSLYIGSSEMFRGVSMRLTDAPSAVAATLTTRVWSDTWESPLDIASAVTVAGVPFAAGGAITWTLPEALVRRSVGGLGPYYWARLSTSATPTAGTTIGPIAVIRYSRLCAPVTYRTLALIFREAPISQDGPWREKAEWYEHEADKAWLRVADRIAAEFDTDNDDAISAPETAQTTAAVAGGWTLERG